jgi:membrane fusion protein (multidrug efflux system)
LEFCLVRLAAAIAVVIFAFTSAAIAQQAGAPTIPVEAAKVESGPLSERVIAIGSLASNESIVVRPEVAGRIMEIGFEEGEPVSQGDLLIKLDDSLNQAEINETEARLKLAERNFERVEGLASNRIATERSRDEARSSLDVSTAALELAKVKLQKTRLVAPFDGIAGLRQVSVGDYVTIGQDLFNLEDIDPIKVDFRIAEKFLPAIRDGQTIEISVDAYPGRIFKGEVYAIDPRIDAAGRSVVLRARVANQERILRPGLFARVTLVLELKPDALTIPEQAIVPRGDSQFVFRIADGKVTQTKVTIGTRRNGRVEIVEGLSSGDTVVTAGHQKLRDGAGVKILGEAATDGNGAPGPSASTDGKGA